MIQWPVEADHVEIAGWISHLPVELDGQDRDVTELTINLSLSVESAALARRLLESWLDESVSLDEMKAMIRDLPRADDPEQEAAGPHLPR